MATKPQLDKDQQKQLDALNSAIETCNAFMNEGATGPSIGTFRKQRAEILKRRDAALKDAGPKLAVTLKSLAAEAKSLSQKAQTEGLAAMAAEKAKEYIQESRGMLAELMLEAGKLKTPSLCEKFTAELSALSAECDKLAKLKPTWDNNTAIVEKFQPRIQDAIKRAKAMQPVSAWLQSSYKPLVAKVESSINAIAQERLRRVLHVEIDFIEAAGRPARDKGDLSGMKSAIVAPMQALLLQAVRVKAQWEALDREMVRVGNLIKDAGAPKDLAGWLAALAKEKAAGWPKAGTAALLDKQIDVWEKDLDILAQTAKRGVAQAAAH